MNRGLTFGAVASLLLLSACGGGGEAGQSTGSTGTPSPSPSPSPAPTPSEITLTLSATTISVQAPTVDRGASQTVDLSLLNLPEATPIYLRGTYTFTGISTAQFEVNGTRVQVIIAFKNPFQTAPGTYTDTIVLHACRDAACVNEIAGSPKTMTINYTVAVPPNPPRIALQANNISAQAFVLDAAPPTNQVISATFSDMGQNTTPFVTLSSTNSAIALTNFSQPAGVAGITGNISIALKPGATLGAGTYTDIVTARACLDQNCVNELAGSPASITVHYTVNNTITGPNGYTVKPVAANAADMVWDPTRQVFYVSIPSTSSTNANTIGVLNPLTGLFSSFVPVGNNPGLMEISPDGQYLYVALRGTASIQRLSLPSLAPDMIIPLGTRPDGSALYAKELHVSPVAPHTVAVVRSTSGTALGSEYDLAIFDDAIMRSHVVGGGTPDHVTTFQWDSGARIFGVDSGSSNGTAYQIGIDASGAQVTAKQDGVTAFDNDAHLVNGKMYMQSGRVFDPLTFSQVGSFPIGPVAGGIAMTADPGSGKAFFLASNQLQSYDLNTLAAGASTPVGPTNPALIGTRLVRWGYDGLAMLNPNSGIPGILLFDGPFIRP